MKNYFKYLLITAATVIFVVPITSSYAASKSDVKATGMSKNSKNHSGHKTKPNKRKVRKSKSDSLVILNNMPNSGKAREVGFDGKSTMETTTILDSEFTLCAKATRGLIMIDNALLRKCGGRPTGWATGPGVATKMDHSKHK